jgi:predicted dehydrogenase
MSSSEKLAVTLIGVGGYGRTWVRLLKDHPHAQVVAVVDTVEQNAREAVQTLSLEDGAIFSDLEDALRSLHADLVIDTTPPRFRLQNAMVAFGSGAHLITAKPLAETVETAIAMVDTAAKDGCRLAVNQQQRYHPVARLLAERIRRGDIGRPVCAYFSFFQRRQWLDRLKDVPSPLFVESSIHHFDLFRFVLGQPIRAVSAVGWTPPDLQTVGKTAGAAWLQMQDGTYVIYTASRSSRNDLDPGYRTGWQGPWIIEGTDGVLRGDDRQGIWHNENSVASPDELSAAARTTDMDRIFFDHFVQSLTGALDETYPFDLDGHQNLNTLAATICAEVSLRQGKWVDITEYIEACRKGSKP